MSSWVGPIPPVVKTYPNFFLSSYTVLIITFSLSGIALTSSTFTPLLFNQKYQYHPEAYKALEEYYKNSDFNEGRKKMAKMPEHAKLIPNPKTFAAGFYVENVFVLPGVPSILQVMIPYLDTIVKSGKKIISVSIDSGLRESTIADELSVIQNNFPDVDIGSYPYFNEKPGTILVLRSVNNEVIKECEKEVNSLIKKITKK